MIRRRFVIVAIVVPWLAFAVFAGYVGHRPAPAKSPTVYVTCYGTSDQYPGSSVVVGADGRAIVTPWDPACAGAK